MSGTYEHFIYTNGDVNALAGTYQVAGFIAVIEHSVMEGYMLVKVYTDLDRHLTSDEDSGTIVRIASERSAIYDGGGAYVGS